MAEQAAPPGAGTTPRQVQERTRVTAHHGFLRLYRLHLRHERFDGTMSAELEREVALLPAHDCACVLPYDPVADAVVLIEQFRPAVHVIGDRPWLIEAVAGLVESGEALNAAARRETREEVGLAVDPLEHVLTYYASPGAYNERTAVFIGRCTAPAPGDGFGADDEHEDIRRHVVPFERAMALLTPEPRAINLIVTLQYLALHRARLRAAWG